MSHHPINARQKRFCENLVLHGMTLARAYRAAGYHTKDPWADAAAFRLRSHPVVAAHLAELHHAHHSALIASRDELLAFHTRVLRSSPAEQLDLSSPLCQATKTIVEKTGAGANANASDSAATPPVVVTETRIRLQTLSKQQSAREIARITGLHHSPVKVSTEDSETDRILREFMDTVVGPQPTVPDQADRDYMTYAHDPAWESYTAWRPSSNSDIPATTVPETPASPSSPIAPSTSHPAVPILPAHEPAPHPFPAEDPDPAYWQKPRALRS